MEVGTTNVNLSTRSVCSCSQKCGLCSVFVVNKPTTSFLSCSQRDAGDVNSTHDISVLQIIVLRLAVKIHVATVHVLKMP